MNRFMLIPSNWDLTHNYVQCSLMAMYGRSGLLRDAELVFETTRNEINVDSWNAMLMGYIQNGLYFVH